MISAEQITEAFDSATRQFRQSDEYQELVAGSANLEVAREFLRNVFRTHFLSSHIVALCFASLPSTAAEMLRRSEEHTSELQSQSNLVCRLLLEKKKKK